MNREEEDRPTGIKKKASGRMDDVPDAKAKIIANLFCWTLFHYRVRGDALYRRNNYNTADIHCRYSIPS